MTMTTRRRLALPWLLACSVLLTACATQSVPEQFALSAPGELRQRMLDASLDVSGFVGEARLTYFGEKGRAKGSATLVVQRPDRIRYEIHGPHGGVLEAFATDGRELQVVDFKSNRYVYGPATVANLDQLFGFAPLGLDAAAWTSMLLGDLVPAEGAEVDEVSGLFRARWEAGGLVRELWVDPATSRAIRALAYRGGEVLSRASVRSRDQRGLPEELLLEVPSVDTQVEIRLRDLRYDPELDPSVFRIDRPGNAMPVYLGP